MIVAFAAIVFSSVGARSQTVSFGLKAGMTAANMKYSYSNIHINTSTKIGYYVGAFVAFSLSGNFGIQPELYYSVLGGKLKDISLFNDLRYANLPVLLKYKHEGFSAFLGPQISYLLSAKSEVNGNSSIDSKDAFKSTDVSGVIGAGYTLTNGVGFDVHYQMGFSNIPKGPAGQETVKNNVYMVGLHYVIN